MQPKQRITAYVQYMKDQKVPRMSYAPGVWLCLWTLGLHLPPPPFMKSVSLAFFSILLAIPVGGVVWLFMFLSSATWPLHAPDTLVPMWGTIFVFAVFLPLGNHIHYKDVARKHGLVDWETFVGHRQ